MKILDALITGVIRSVKTWKGILIIWFVSLLLVSLVAMPLKSSILSGFGNSTITEKLKDGFNTEVFRDLGAGYKSLTSFFSKGLLMVLVVGFLFNSFFSGGLFDSMKALQGGFSTGEFFRASSRNFWPVFVISLIVSIIVLVLTILLIIIPVVIAGSAKVVSDVAVFNAGLFGSSIFIFCLIVLILIADYARAWQIVQNKSACFKALGYGFRSTFAKFYSSYPLMLIILLVQVVFIWIVLHIVAGIKPVSSAGILILFLLSQFLFIIKILLKSWRYGCVTRMMELNSGIFVSKEIKTPDFTQPSAQTI
jgi:hypothetical protein